MNPSRYLIMAGGTGGHIFPALAVAKELMQRDAKVVWLGTAAGMEANIIAKEGIPLRKIMIKGFRGKGLSGKLMAPLLLARAVLQAMSIIRKEKPDVIVGFGGFVAAPGGIAARLMGKKLVIHEQNSIAGSTNRLLAKLATMKLEAFPKALNDAVHVGNPVRPSLSQLNKVPATDNKIRLLIMGGSLGAKAINDVLPGSLAAINTVDRPHIWHQTGRDKKQPVVDAYQALNIDARVDEFITNVDEAYEWADLLICRAGALTVSEVSVAGVAAIFIPLPSAIDNHQFYNAKWLADQGAAILLEQSLASQTKITEEIERLMQQPQQLITMSEKAKSLALPNATHQVANLCEEVCHA